MAFGSLKAYLNPSRDETGLPLLPLLLPHRRFQLPGYQPLDRDGLDLFSNLLFFKEAIEARPTVVRSSLVFFLCPSAFYESQESCPYACHYTSATSRSKFGFFSAWSFRATPQAVAMRSSIASECPVYSASSRRAITDCVVPTFLASSA